MVAELLTETRRSIEEIAEMPGVKLLDTNCFSSRKCGLLSRLYDCRVYSEIPVKIIQKEIEVLNKIHIIMQREDVFSIEEAAQETEAFMERVNRLTGYYAEQFKPRKFHPRINRRGNQRVENTKPLLYFQDGNSPDALAQMNLLGKSLYRLIRQIRQRDIKTRFSKEDKKVYEEFSAFFFNICDKENLKEHPPYEEVALRSKHPPTLLTDKKIVAAAFTSANVARVILLSSNNEIISMFNYNHRHPESRRGFNLRPTRHPIELYSNYDNQGFSRILIHAPEVCS